MKRATALTPFLCVIVGCFGKPTTNVQVTGKNDVPQAAAKTDVVAAQPAQDSAAASASQETKDEQVAEQIVAAQDTETVISDIETGDPVLEESVKFSADRAGIVTVKSSVTDGLRFFKIRPDQFNQTELVADLQNGQNGVQISLPAAGTYLVAGREKPLPFADIPLGGDGVQTQYRVQSVQGCPPVERELKHLHDGYPATHYAWTRNIEFPAKVKVYLHRGAGNSNEPMDNFQNWVDYNKTQSPDKAALADRVRAYVRDPWNSYFAPDIAAKEYNNRRINCGTPGEAWVDVCHSAGCLKARLALLWRENNNWTWNNLGIIAVAPAVGGSHWVIKDLTDASLALNYKDKAVLWGSVRTLIQLEWGMLLLPSIQKIFLKDALAGTRFSLYNEGARSLAWTGAGTGIPTMNYPWYSLFSFGKLYLKLRLKPEVRYIMPAGNSLADFAPGRYTWPGDTQSMFNYIEAVQELEKKDPEKTDGKMDIAVCYLDDTTSLQQAKIRQFEKEYANVFNLNLLWAAVDKPLRRRFVNAALPWMNAVIAKAPSVVPNDPEPNENAINDGALTVSQQLGLLDGPSILAPGSKYGALVINKAAVDARLPRRVGSWKEFPKRDHKKAVEGDPELWDWTNSKLIACANKLRDEERNYVLTDAVKREIINTIGPPDGRRIISSDLGLTLSGGYQYSTITTYALKDVSYQWTQDPLETEQRNRVRVNANGLMTISMERWNDILRKHVETLEGWDFYNWKIQEDFIVRNGVPQLVVN